MSDPRLFKAEELTEEDKKANKEIVLAVKKSFKYKPRFWAEELDEEKIKEFLNPEKRIQANDRQLAAVKKYIAEKFLKKVDELSSISKPQDLLLKIREQLEIHQVKSENARTHMEYHYTLGGQMDEYTGMESKSGGRDEKSIRNSGDLEKQFSNVKKTLNDLYKKYNESNKENKKNENANKRISRGT